MATSEDMPPQFQEKPLDTESMSVVNIREMKKKVVNIPKLDESVWYNRKRTWLLGGFIFDIFFLLLSFWDLKMLLLLPLGPIAGIAGWYILKLSKRYEKYDEKFF